jgi:hypothetical protein
MFLAKFRKEFRTDENQLSRGAAERRLKAATAIGPAAERKKFPESCFKWNLGRPSRATKRVLKFILGSGFSVLTLGGILSILGFVLPEGTYP